MSKSLAFEVGYAAWLDSLAKSDNPYREGTHDHNEWLSGWRKAMNDVVWGATDTAAT